MHTVIALGTFKDGKAAVLVLAGNLFIALMVLRALGHYAQKQWGELVGFVFASALVGFIVYFPATAIGALQSAARYILA